VVHPEKRAARVQQEDETYTTRGTLDVELGLSPVSPLGVVAIMRKRISVRLVSDH
jgi:hypothetical protein